MGKSSKKRPDLAVCVFRNFDRLVEKLTLFVLEYNDE